MLDRRLCEDAINQNEPPSKLQNSSIHSAADVNVKHILVATMFLQGIWLVRALEVTNYFRHLHYIVLVYLWPFYNINLRVPPVF